MTDLDLNAIQTRSDAAGNSRRLIKQCEFLRVTPSPHSHDVVAKSQDDVPALLARVRELEAQVVIPPAITGSVGFDVNTPPYVDLILANGARVRGFVDDGLGKLMSWSNPFVEQGGE